MIRFRASSLADIMTEPKTKDEILSKGAKTLIEAMAKEYIYGYHKTISGKEMEKGIVMEDCSIALYNDVFFTDYAKNTERKENDWISGECDIFTGSKIIDIKSSWSIPTFPATTATAAAQSKERGYDWQLRAYMWLWNVDESEVAYCMVSTPDELIGYEAPELHYVDHINPALRVTIAKYQRDHALEEKIKEKVEAANHYMQQLVLKIQSEHHV
jgi:hypothetical protein